MDRPIFSERLDADPTVKVWMAGLDAATVRALRDDVTPSFKEIPTAHHHMERTTEDVADIPTARARQPGYALEVKASLTQAEKQRHLRLALERDRARDDADGDDDLRAAILTAAIDVLPLWRFRVFASWLQGANRYAIARELGVSRSTVRSALDGEGAKRAGPGALAIITNTLRGSEDFRKVVAEMATKKQKEQIADERVLGWFKGIENKPDLVLPLAMLLVVDDLKDARGEVGVADVFPYFPRALVTPCMTLLRAHGYASCDGHRIRIVRTPISAKE